MGLSGSSHTRFISSGRWTSRHVDAPHASSLQSTIALSAKRRGVSCVIADTIDHPRPLTTLRASRTQPHARALMSHRIATNIPRRQLQSTAVGMLQNTPLFSVVECFDEMIATGGGGCRRMLNCKISLARRGSVARETGGTKEEMGRYSSEQSKAHRNF